MTQSVESPPTPLPHSLPPSRPVSAGGLDNSVLVRRKAEKLPGLHGLRALAALMVIAFHMRDVAGVSPPFGFDRYLGDGVRLFFMISAFSLMISTGKYIDRLDWVRVFATKRLFRIAPMFYFAIAINLYFGYMGRHDWTDVLLSATFLFNFLPNQISSVVWAGWTVGAEMVFYALFPIAIAVVTGLRGATALFIVSIAVSNASLVSTQRDGLPVMFDLITFPGQIQFFSAGILVFFLFKILEAMSPNGIARTIPALIMVIVIGIVIIAGSPPLERDYIAEIFIFGAMILWQSSKPLWIFRNTGMVALGERSYSIYLLHGPVLIALRSRWEVLAAKAGPALAYPAATTAAIAIVAALSFVTYALVERPGMAVGAWLHGPRPNWRTAL